MNINRIKDLMARLTSLVCVSFLQKSGDELTFSKNSQAAVPTASAAPIAAAFAACECACDCSTHQAHLQSQDSFKLRHLLQEGDVVSHFGWCGLLSSRGRMKPPFVSVEQVKKVKP